MNPTSDAGMLAVDGCLGEGGGQILRTSLSLSAITGRSFRITDIRKHRSRPGLMSQHLTCVQAAAALCNAEVSGDFKGSTDLEFHPGLIRGGNFSFDIQTAGSALLVFQTLFPILSMAAEESELELTGGTHNPHAPPFEFIDKIFLPAVAELGFRADMELVRYGFFPRGGGIVKSRIYPRAGEADLDLTIRGRLRTVRTTVLIADLSEDIAQREARILGRELKRSSLPAEVVHLPQGQGPGNAILLHARYSGMDSLFSSPGRKGKRAEAVARDVVAAWRAFHQLEVPVQPELADQLLLPMAMAGAGAFLTGPLTPHALTHLSIIGQFMGPCFKVTQEKAGRTLVEFRK
ncbi:MAG: RNA 3'-terminal phosphate cyclase [Planctomycetota bacterium]